MFSVFLIIIIIIFIFIIHTDQFNIEDNEGKNIIAVEDRYEKTIYLWNIDDNAVYTQKKVLFPLVIGEPYYNGEQVFYRKGIFFKGNYYNDYYSFKPNKYISYKQYNADEGNDIIYKEWFVRENDKNGLSIINTNSGNIIEMPFAGEQFAFDGEKICVVNKNDIIIYDIESVAKPFITFKTVDAYDGRKDSWTFVESVGKGRFFALLDSGKYYLIDYIGKSIQEGELERHLDTGYTLGENNIGLSGNSLYYLSEDTIYNQRLDSNRSTALVDLSVYVDMSDEWDIRVYYRQNAIVIVFVPYFSDTINDTTCLAFDYDGKLLLSRKFG